MVNLIKRLFGKSNEPEYLEWLQQVTELNRQFEDMNLIMEKAIQNESLEVKLAALNKAIIDIPELIRKFEALPPKSERNVKAFDFFLEGLNTYSLACQYYKKSLEENNDIYYELAIRRMKKAVRLIKQI